MTVSDTEPPTYRATCTKNADTIESAWHPTPYLAARDILRAAKTWHTVADWVEAMPTGPWHEAAIRTFRHLLPNGGAAMDYRIDTMQARIDSLENAVRDLYQTVVKLHVALDRQKGKV
jgi:hypothetical protein